MKMTFVKIGLETVQQLQEAHRVTDENTNHILHCIESKMHIQQKLIQELLEHHRVKMRMILKTKNVILVPQLESNQTALTLRL